MAPYFVYILDWPVHAVRKIEGAGTDACLATERGKLSKHGPFLGELHADGLDYRPVVWSCWGRPSTEARVAVRTLASAAARWRSLGDPRVLERHVCGIISSFIWRRAASMVHACVGWHAREDIRELLVPPSADDCESASAA